MLLENTCKTFAKEDQQQTMYLALFPITKLLIDNYCSFNLATLSQYALRILSYFNKNIPSKKDTLFPYDRTKQPDNEYMTVNYYLQKTTVLSTQLLSSIHESQKGNMLFHNGQPISIDNYNEFIKCNSQAVTNIQNIPTELSQSLTEFFALLKKEVDIENFNNPYQLDENITTHTKEICEPFTKYTERITNTFNNFFKKSEDSLLQLDFLDLKHDIELALKYLEEKLPETMDKLPPLLLIHAPGLIPTKFLFTYDYLEPAEILRLLTIIFPNRHFTEEEISNSLPNNQLEPYFLGNYLLSIENSKIGL